jgi:WD40 repeat protein/serine/threonine protein kinase
MPIDQPNLDEEAIFNAAKQFADPRQLAAYLDVACKGKPDMRRRIERLLGASAEADDFFQRQAPSAAGTRPVDGISTVVTPISETPGTLIGRYKLLQKIGEGGCGVVFMAEQEEPVRRRVALKVIKLGMDTKSVIARFEAERQALALMDHPNIAKVLDAGATETGRPYFVMELVRGIKITEYCDQNNLPARERLDLFVQVCRAIQHAHQKGIIHRDIKPSNILVTLHDGVAVPKVIDFGIAKATTDQRLTDKTLFTQFEQFIGTPAYMSPEQAEMSGLDIDTRTDIYSLGVLLYELLTGKTPFDAEELLRLGLEEMRRTIREREPARPSTRLSTMLECELSATAKHRASEAPKLIHLLRGDLDWIVMKALEKDRTRRYETANGMAMDIQRHLKNEPIVARPPSASYRFQKLVRRNKLAFAAIAAVAGVLVLGVVASTWQAVRATRAKDNEEKQRLAAETARTLANTAAERASRNATESRERLVRLNVANGARLVKEGDLTGALLWYVEALKLDQGKPEAEAMHRLRIGSVLQQCPRLTQLWFHSNLVFAAEFSPDGRRIATISGDAARGGWIPSGRGIADQIVAAVLDGELRVWDAFTGREVMKPLEYRSSYAELLIHPFSPDGQRLVTVLSRQTLDGGLENEIRLVDSGSGQLAVPPLRYDGVLCYVGFSSDSRRLVLAGGKGTRADALTGEAQVWDTLTGQPLGAPFRHEGPIGHASFSPDGRRVVTASTDRTARVWDAVTGEELLVFHGSSSASYAEFSHDGKHVVVNSREGELQVRNATTGVPETQAMRNSGGAFYSVFSPNDRRVLSASFDTHTYLWDAATGQLIWKWTHDGPVYRALFSPDGALVLASRAGRSARMWDVQTGLPYGPPLYHAGEVLDARFSPDGHHLLTAGLDQTVRLWDLTACQTNVITLKHGPGLVHAEFSTDGLRVLTSGSDAPVRIWDTPTGQLLLTGQPLIGPSIREGPVNQAAFSSDSRLFLTIGADRNVTIWDSATGQQAGHPLRHSSPVWHAEFSRDNRRVLIVSNHEAEGIPVGTYLNISGNLSPNVTSTSPASGEARVWDALTGEPLTPPFAESTFIHDAAFSPDGRAVVTASFDHTAQVWDAATGRPVSPRVVHIGEVHSVAFSPDGRKVVSYAAVYKNFGSVKGEARIWDARTGTLLVPPIQLDEADRGFAAFSHNGKQVVTASSSGACRVWDATTGEPRTPWLHHDSSVEDAEFSPDDRFMLTASWDNTARLWNAATGEQVVQFQHAGLVWSASFSPDGRHVVTASADGTAKIWSLPSENRPLEDLRLLAGLLSARKIAENGGGLEPVDTATLSNAWRTLRAKYPGEFGAPE